MARTPFDRKHTASDRALAPRSTGRIFAISAVATLIPVVALAIVLDANYRTHANMQGLSEGHAEAMLLATTAIEPALDSRSLDAGLTPHERANLDAISAHAWHGMNFLRFRLRDLSGKIVWASDNSATEPHDRSALIAAGGRDVVEMTTLSGDDDQVTSKNPQAVEVYTQIREANKPVGVLEVYLPYSPIAQNIASATSALSDDLIVGLGLLYLVLFGISFFVTRRLRQQSAANAHLAEHDPLTGLANRALFHNRVEEAVQASMRGEHAVIAVLDLDRFKEVNDSLGHVNGDELLVTLAVRLAASIAEPDVIARIGGDEFGVILRGCADPFHTLVDLRRLVEQEIEISSLPLSVEASIGFALLDGEEMTMKEILQRADIAMYSAKEHHLGVVAYQPTMARYDAANLGLVTELRRAIDDEQLVLHYQPESTVADGKVRAIEALVRWQHPTLGLLAPDRFLPLAEQTDLIESLTTWVIHRALDDLHRLPPEIAVAVNVSARTLSRLEFADEVVTALAEAQIDPSRLVIEVTETALMTDPTRAALVLSALAAVGIHIALDDFGVGQTSLGYLSSLPVHELKIDRSFVSDMEDDPKHRAIVRSIIELGHNLSLNVIGEGVETVSVLDGLESVGCDTFQGYLLARPMTIEALVEWFGAAARRERITTTAR